LLKAHFGAAETPSATAGERRDLRVHASAEVAPEWPAETLARPSQAARAAAQAPLVRPETSAQRVSSSLPGAAAGGVAASVRAVPRSEVAAAGAAPDVRVQPREAAEAEPDAERAAAAEGAAVLDARPVEVAAAELGAEPVAAEEEEVVVEPGAEAGLRPGAAARGAPVRQPAAGPSVFRRDRVLPSAP